MAIPLCTVFLIGLFVVGCSPGGMEVGDSLPNLHFYDLDGNKVSIYDYIEPGKVLLLHLWGAACCLTYSIPTTKAVKEIASDGDYNWVTVVSVNLDYPISRVRRIAEELGISHTMLNDMDGRYYYVEGEFRLFFPLAIILAVDDNGIVRGRLQGHQLAPAIRELLMITRDRRE